MDSYDLVIIGAGFAGLFCARVAAERGLRVVVLDRKAEPGAQLHTTGIIVKEAAEGLEIPPRICRRIEGVRLYSPGLGFVDMRSPGYYFMATDTGGILRWLADETRQAGATIAFAHPFTGARREGGWIILDGPAMRARYLVGADGARSAVARCFGLGANHRMLVGVETEFTGVQGVEQRRLHCFLDRDLAPGYIGWVVPGVRVTQVGLACRDSVKPNHERFLDKMRTIFDFSDARVVERRSGPIPVGGTVQPFTCSRVLLIGDAAGLVSPLTAGGIYPALRYGKRAADVIADHLLHDGPDPGPVLAREYPRYRWKALLRRGLDRDPPNWLYDWSLGLPPTRAFARLVYFHHMGLKSGAAWRDLFRRNR